MRPQTRTLAFAAVLAVLLGARGTVAEQNAATGAAQPTTQNSKLKTEPKSQDVSFGAKSIRAPWGGPGVTVMKGDVWFQHEDTRVSSDQVNYDSREKVKEAVSPGRIAISNPECDISGDKGSASFIKRLGVIDGHVVMLVKPKQDAKEAAESTRNKLRKPTTVTCDKIEYLYKKKVATALGGVVFEQEKRRATADKAIYDLKNELLTLVGNVKAVDEEGQTFSAPKAVISLKKGDEWIDAPNATVTTKMDLEEEPEQPKKP